MPHMVNGIGTWYYGRSRVHTLRGVCEHCRAVCDLTSYDTTLYFTVVFIPVIPLSKKRILQQCARCGKHFVIKSKDWEESKSRDSAAVLEKLQADPDDREAVLQALALAMKYQDQGLFDRVADTLASHHQNDAEVQTLLGQGYGYSGRHQEAETAYRQTLRAGDSTEGRERLGMNLLKQGRPDDAEPCLAHCYDAPDGAVTLYWLVVAYQAQGRHEDALRVMDAIFGKWPELAANGDWQKLQKTSTKYRATTKRVAAPLLGAPKSAGYQEGGWRSKVPRYILPALLVAGLLAYVGMAVYKGKAREVYLVNGTPVPYVVAINGAEHNVAAGRPSPIQLPEGEIKIALRSPGLPAEEQTCRIETSFWTRPFDSSTFVLNPDRVAILVREATVYSDKPVQANEGGTTSTGQLLHEFQGIDYRFQPFPQNITVQSGGQYKKYRIDLMSISDAESRLGIAAKGRSPQELQEYAKRWLVFQPDDTVTLLWLTGQLDPTGAAAYLTPRLAERPVRTEWHRAYQLVVERTQPERDLIPEYRKLVEATGRAPDAVYLLARLCPREECLKLLEEAARGTPPSHLAESSLGYHALSEGRFDDAVMWCRKAVEGAPGQPLLEYEYQQALWATRDYDGLLRLSDARMAAHPDAFTERLEQANILLAKGDAVGGRRRLNELLGLLGPGPSPQKKMLSDVFELGASTVKRDPAAYLRIADGSTQLDRFFPALLRNQPQAAADSLRESSRSAEETRYGLLYLCAQRNGPAELAEEAFSQYVAILRRGGRDDRAFAEMLTGAGPTPDQVRLLDMEVKTKRVAVAVVARKFPNLRAELAPFAQRLNFECDVEGLCLAQELR